jgi:uncharacterized protein (DUF488 family)
MLAPLTLYSIGHGDRPLHELIAMLRAAAVTTLVDVRAQPRSLRHPQYDEASLRAACEALGMVYHWAGRQLGGHRPGRSDSRHVALKDAGLRGYADYMDSAEFRKGAAALVKLASGACAAILCAERDPARCHRSLIADYLTLQGLRVVHLLAPETSCEHLLSPHARRESAELVYDRGATAPLTLD